MHLNSTKLRFRSRLMLCLVLPLFGVVLNSCGGDEFDANVSPGGGMLTIDGGTTVPLVINTVALAIANSAATITLTNSVAGNASTFDNISIVLVLPSNQVHVPIDLSKTASTFTETTVSGTGTVITTDFKSTKVTGSAYIDFLSNVATSGHYNATFTDNVTGKTRQVTGGTFLRNSK